MVRAALLRGGQARNPTEKGAEGAHMEPIGAFERSANSAVPGEGPSQHGATAESGWCQVRSETDFPCDRPAAVEILGVRFCARCSWEQETYFRIGELTQVPRGERTWSSREVGVERPLRSGVPTGPRQRLRKVATGSKVSFLSIALAASLLALAACGGTVHARGETAAEPKGERLAGDQGRVGAVEVTKHGPEEGRAAARAGDAEASEGGGSGEAVARADAVQAQAGNPAEDSDKAAEGAAADDATSDGPSRKLTLQVRGDRGTEFSGVRSVGDEEKALEGRTPERYAFERRDAKLECELQNDGGGALEVTVAGEGVRSVQQVGSRAATVRFALSDGGFSSSTSSFSAEQNGPSPGGSSPNGAP